MRIRWTGAGRAVAAIVQDMPVDLSRQSNGDLALASDGTLRWIGAPIGTLVEGEDALKPRVLLFADEQLTGPARDKVMARAERYVAYHCVVVPPPGIGRWSGRSDLVPSGWSIGPGAAEWRVCRRSRDLDGSGAVDGNAEHPAIYQNVAGPLRHQNFLVVRGNETCPSGLEPHQP